MENTALTGSDITGKKIFFLYPQTIIQNEVVTDLIMQEFEVYTVRDHLALRRVLKRFPDSIVFVNIDEKIQEKEWETWIRGVMTDPATAKVSIGVLSSSTNDELKIKYTTQVKVPCGCIHVSTDLKKLIIQLAEVLKKQNAMGRRKYLRAVSENETMTTANIPLEGRFLTGSIHDISSAGFSCVFPEDPQLAKGTLLPNIQLKLQSTLMRAEAVVFGSRAEDLMRIYVFVFTPRTDSDVRSKIRKYIQGVIQAKMDMEMKK
jgi:hypothetical protein